MISAHAAAVGEEGNETGDACRCARQRDPTTPCKLGCALDCIYPAALLLACVPMRMQVALAASGDHCPSQPCPLQACAQPWLPVHHAAAAKEAPKEAARPSWHVGSSGPELRMPSCAHTHAKHCQHARFCVRYHLAEHDTGSVSRRPKDRSTSPCASVAPRTPRCMQGSPQGPPATSSKVLRAPHTKRPRRLAARWPAQRPTQASAPFSCQAMYFLPFCANKQMQQIKSVL